MLNVNHFIGFTFYINLPLSPMSLIRKLAGQTMVYGIGHILGKVLYFLLLSSFLTYELKTTKSFGIYSELYAYASLLVVLFSYRIDTAFFRFGSKKDNLEKAYSSALIPLLATTAIVVVIGLWLAPSIAKLLRYDSFVYYMQWFVWIIAFDVLLLLPFARLRLEEKPKTFVIYRLINIALTIVFVLFFLKAVPWLIRSGYPSFEQLLFFEDQVDYVFFSNLIVSGLMLLIMSPILLKANVRVADLKVWKKMVWYAAPLIVVGIANSINQFFAVPLQHFLLGEGNDNNLTQAGIYAGPQKIAALIGLVTTAFNYAAEPFFFRHAADRSDRTVYGDVAKAFTIVIGFIILCMLFYLDILKHLIDVQKYGEGFVIVPILLFAYFFLGLYYNISIWYKLADKTYWGAIISIIGVVVTLTLSFSLLSTYGYIVSAWAALACFAVMCSIAYVVGQVHYKIDYPIGKIVLIMGIVLILYLISNYFTEFGNMTFPMYLTNTALLGLYVIVIWFLEKEFIKTKILS